MEMILCFLIVKDADYIDTYFDPNEAIKEAELLSGKEDVSEVSVHHWILKDDGKQEHTENNNGKDIPYYFLNREHRELKENQYGLEFIDSSGVTHLYIQIYVLIEIQSCIRGRSDLRTAFPILLH